MSDEASPGLTNTISREDPKFWRQILRHSIQLSYGRTAGPRG